MFFFLANSPATLWDIIVWLFLSIVTFIGIYLVITHPLTIACRFVPEVLMQKFTLKEFPEDLKLLLKSFLLLGTVAFWVSVIGAIITSPRGVASILDFLLHDGFAAMVILWGTFFHGGTIVSWLKQRLLPKQLPVDLTTLEILTMLPIVMGLAIIASLLR